VAWSVGHDRDRAKQLSRSRDSLGYGFVGSREVGNHGAVKFLIAELRDVSRRRYFTVKILTAGFAVASKTAKKIFAAF